MKSIQELQQLSNYYSNQYQIFHQIYKRYCPKFSLTIHHFKGYLVDESGSNLFEWGSVDYMLEINKHIELYENKFKEYHLLAENILNGIVAKSDLSAKEISTLFDYTFIVWRLEFLTGELSCILEESKSQ